MAKGYIYLIIGLVIGIVVMSAFSYFYGFKTKMDTFKERSVVMVNLQKILMPFSFGANFATSEKETEFWKAHEIEKVNFEFRKLDALSDNNTCDSEFDGKSYPVDFGTKTEDSPVIPRRFCDIQYVTVEEGEVIPGLANVSICPPKYRYLNIGCECWYVKSA